jgi:hypothetical protein
VRAHTGLTRECGPVSGRYEQNNEVSQNCICILCFNMYVKPNVFKTVFYICALVHIFL